MVDRYRDILVIDLLGGLGDLVMVLPVVHALARHNPGARLRVLTHSPGDTLLRADPAVAEISCAERGGERAAVAAELDRRPPDLVVSTTRYDGIAGEIESRGVRCVTNLWRSPPPDLPVTERYLQILAEEGLVGHGADARPVIHLTDGERERGLRLIAAHAPSGAPVVLVPGAGMAVKWWPHWPQLAEALSARGEPVLVVGEEEPHRERVGPLARPLPPTDLRGLAGLFAAVGLRGGTVVGADTGPMRVAAAVGARTVGLFGPTVADRYGLPGTGPDLQGLPDCPHRRPTAITEQVCWWAAECPLSTAGPACMDAITAHAVLDAVACSR